MSDYSLYDDSDLVLLLGKGDGKAFTEIYDRYWERLFSVAANKLQDLHLAEELVQDLFMSIWSRRHSLTISGQLAAYLAVAMKYKIIDARARRSRTRADVLPGEAIAVPDDSTRQQLQFEELQDRLAALVGQLPDKCRLVYRLSRESGMSGKEIAGHLGIAEKTVEAHLTRALKSLQSGLDRMLFSLL